MTPRLVMLAAALVLAASATDAWAEPGPQKQPKSAPAAVQEPPLQLYLAKGGANACGEECSEWIAAEGYFDRDSAARVQAFLRRHAGRKLAIYFHSPGGVQAAALAIGRLLRERGMTAGVAKTIPRACTSAVDRSEACRAAKRSGQPVAAEWRPDANCSSACVYALIGAKVRHVPPTARLGVHSGRLIQIQVSADGRVKTSWPQQLSSRDQAKVAEFDAQLRRYVREMGIDAGLFEAAAKVPYEKAHYLSRDEIAAFGIDAREFQETPWVVVDAAPNSIFVGKSFVEAKGADHKEFRMSLIYLSCAGPRRAAIFYSRGLATGEAGKAVKLILSIGGQNVDVSQTGHASRIDAFDTGGMFAKSQSYAPFDLFDAAAATGTIEVIEADPWTLAKPPRVTTLSTQGLAEGIKVLREKCA